MKYTIPLLCFFLSANLLSQIPQLSWAEGFGSSSNDYPDQMVLDDTGNVYLVGEFQFTVDFDPGPAVYNLTALGGYEVYVLKLDASGNFIWAKSMGGTGTDGGRSIGLDPNGNVIITGYCSSLGGDFDPGPATFNISSFGGTDVFICKLDNAGNFLWAKSFGGTSNDYSTGINCDSFGNIYAMGYFVNTIDFDPSPGISNLTSAGMNDIYLSKLDPSGNFIWAKRIGGTLQDYGAGLDIDLSNNLCVTGFFQGSSDFDPGLGTFNLTSFGTTDIYVLQLNNSGNLIWVKQLGGPGDDQGVNLTVDGLGNIYTTGYFNATADFDPGAGINNLTSAGGDDIFISKLDSSGNFIWAKQIGGSGTDQGEDIVVDMISNVYITGYFNGVADFDPGIGTNNITSVGSNDVFISVLNSFGNFLSAGGMGSTTSDLGICIAVDTSGGLFVGGRFTGTMDFDLSPSIFNVGTNGVTDIFIAKYATCLGPPTQPAIISGPFNICVGSQNTYSISSVNGAYSYTWNFPPGWLGNSNDTSIVLTSSDSSGIITVIANNSCGSSLPQFINITVNNLPTVNANATDTNLCAGESTTLTAGGANSYTWSGGITNGIPFNPVSTTTYTLIGTDINNCTDTTSIIITVNNLPSVNFSYSGKDTVCISEGIQTLSGGAPGGGIYSGSGVSGTNFDPIAAGLGTHTITYSYTDGNNCTNTSNIQITVIGCTEIENNGFMSISIYPNPFTNSFVVNGIENNTTVYLFNVFSKIVDSWAITDANYVIQTNNLRSGIYFLQIGTTTVKLIKE